MSKIFEYIKKYDILVFIILGLVLYFPTVFYDFVSDDLTMLLPNPYLNGKFLINFVDFFIPNLICKDIYTPLSFIIYWLIIKIFGISSYALHFVNIVFFVLSTIVLFYLLKKIINNYSVVFFAVILYILHPCHIENTAWISGMGYNISALFFFLSFLYFIIAFDENKKINYLSSVIFYILAILSQPIAVTLPAILFLWVYFFRREKFKESIKYICAYIPFLLVYFYLYYISVFTTGRFNLWNYTFLEKFSFLGFDIFNVFIPINLCVVQPFPNLYFIIFLLLYFCVLYFFRDNKLFLFFSLWGLITVIPYSNFIYNIAIPISDRYLLLFSVTSCVFLSNFSFYLSNKLKNRELLKYISFIFFIGLYFCSFIMYLPIWKNDRILWSYAYNINPNNITVAISYSNFLIEDKKYDEALILSENLIKKFPFFYEGYKLKIKALMGKCLFDEAYNLSLKINELNMKDFNVYIDLFDIYINLQKYDMATRVLYEAEYIFKQFDEYRKKIFLDRKIILSFVKVESNEFIENFKVISNDFILLQDNGEFSEILNKDNYNNREEICLSYLKKYNSEYSRYVINLLSCLYMQETYKKDAQKVMRELLKEMNKAQNFISKGDNDFAEHMYLLIISKNKYMYEAYYNLGILYFQTNRQDKAKEIFSKMLEINPNDEQIKQILMSLWD